MAALVRSLLYHTLFKFAFVLGEMPRCVEAPAKARHHDNCKGGLEGMVGQLHHLGGDHEAFVVGSGANLDFNIAKVQPKSSCCNSLLFLRLKLDWSCP